jgi:hypothetical protein
LLAPKIDVVVGDPVPLFASRVDTTDFCPWWLL